MYLMESNSSWVISSYSFPKISLQKIRRSIPFSSTGASASALENTDFLAAMLNARITAAMTAAMTKKIMSVLLVLFTASIISSLPL